MLNANEPDQKTFNYRKKDKILKSFSGVHYVLEKEVKIENGSLKKKINYDTYSSSKLQIEFKFFEEENLSISIASDKINA